MLTLLSSLIVCALAGTPAQVGPSPQEGTPAPPNDPGHDHGKPDAGATGLTKQDAARFITSRKSGIDLPLPSEEDSFFFAVYGDRTGGPASGVQILREAVAETNLLGPDLVMTVGDLIEGYNTEEPWMEQMAEYKDAMAPLRMPWFPVAGNHDIYYRPEKGGAPRPAEEHEGRYEMHFGPLWYAFKHKSAWFIVLYTDEANPDTGERNFNKADSQRMSPEQLSWLDETLKITSQAEHCFVFCHHPRWVGGNYGDDWDKVHERLVKAGNIKGVFGGHIHRMRYDPKDGIEYFALATIGGHQNGTVPEAGFLHCYDIVTVRKDRIERATLPVGAAMDPREITGEVSAQAPKLVEVRPHWRGALRLGVTGEVSETIGFTVTNPTPSNVELEARFQSTDPRWRFTPDHVHGKIGPKGSLRVDVRVSRDGNSIDGGLAIPTMTLGFDYLTETARFAIPIREILVPFDLATLPPPAIPELEQVLDLDGARSHIAIAPRAVGLPDGPFTVETWVNPNSFKGRQGVVGKTESSEFGFFANNGELTYMVHLDGAYHEAAGPKSSPLVKGKWQHIAGVFDGEEIRLYLDGQLIGRKEASGKRTPNNLPFIIGGDVDRRGNVTASLKGQLDEVRLSRGAVYTGESFQPARRLGTTKDTVLYLPMDAAIGPYLRGGMPAGATLKGGARLLQR